MSGPAELLALLAAPATALPLAEAKPAGGAPLDQIAVLALVNVGGSAALLWLVHAHWRGRSTLLARAGAGAAWVFRLPPWAALPIAVAVVALLATMFGGFWDIGYHIDVGRDEGPLGNAGHWPMLAGFFGVFAAGVLSVALARGEPAEPGWVRLAPGFRAPVGGLLLIACGIFALLALPLDDVWHRIFGQDVTLWSPTHFMLLGGGTFAVIGMVVLVAEGGRARRRLRGATRPAAANGRPWATLELFGGAAPWARVELLRGRELARRAGRVWLRVQRYALLGGMLVGLEAFLAEYDWGVPLYRQVWQPLLLAAAAGFVFTAARGWAGRGGALGAWGFYLAIRSAATLMPVLAGRSAALLPLLLAEAACVELAATRLDPRRRPLAFGAGAGLLCGTVGFAAEYAWSQVAMPLPWTPALLAEGLPTAALAGIAGGLLGALLAAGLRAELPRPRVARLACAGSLALLVALGANAAIRELPDARATVELTEVGEAPERTALATVRLSPPDAAEDANWLYALAWQGGERRIVDPMREIAPGVFRSTEPLPLYGSWKSGLRLQRGRERGAVPLRLPADPGIEGADEVLPASFTDAAAAERRIREGAAGAELPAPARFERAFLDDGLIVLREQNGGVAGWLWAVAIALIGLVYALFIAALAIGVGRSARAAAAQAPATTAVAEPMNSSRARASSGVSPRSSRSSESPSSPAIR